MLFPIVVYVNCLSFLVMRKIVLSKVQNRERHIHDSSLMDKEGIKCKIKQEGSLQVKRSLKRKTTRGNQKLLRRYCSIGEFDDQMTWLINISLVTCKYKPWLVMSLDLTLSQTMNWLFIVGPPQKPSQSVYTSYMAAFAITCNLNTFSISHLETLGTYDKVRHSSLVLCG